MSQRMTPDRILTLQLAAGATSLQTTTALLTNPAKAGGLVRRGLLESFDQSDHVRGEKRFHYRLYRITEKGRRLVEEAGHGRS